jgi:hypothetical protein
VHSQILSERKWRAKWANSNAHDAGRAPLVLEILGPNYTPLQDLAHFWRVRYPELRAALKRSNSRQEWR